VHQKYFSRKIIFLIVLTICICLAAVPEAGADSSCLTRNQPQSGFLEARTPEKKLFQIIRQALCGHDFFALPQNLSFNFHPEISQVYITLLQPGQRALRWGARRHDLAGTLKRIVNKIRTLPRFNEFAISDPDKCRLLFEMVVSEKKGDLSKLETGSLSENRFEPGITGLKYTLDGFTRYFMPTDAVLHSIMSRDQLLNYLTKKCGIASKTPRISERIKLLLQAAPECRLLTSKAWVSYRGTVLALYRGAPELTTFNKETLYSSLTGGIDWLYDNMNPDGSFLYYYDGIKDSRVDFMHPHRKDPLYYNILRHSGGTIALLWGYELTGQEKYLKAAKKSLEFMVATFVRQAESKDFSCYPFFNRKAKLGGAGVGLVALARYTGLSGDYTFAKEMAGLVRHILSRIDDNGEMIGYYIHPKYSDGEPIIDPEAAIKKELFSFYYPGEALLGLALYYRHIESRDEKLRAEVRRKSLSALDFLVEKRPRIYADMFTSLPADAWLMQAIEEWVKIEGFRKKSYIDFVFNDADAMLNHTYNAANVLYPDYIGGFYYNFGDHVYHDASRCEGLIAAYGLAKYLKNDNRAWKIKAAMLLAAKGIMRLRYTPESAFAHLYPKKSIGSFRFKLTRSWIRVDSTQHTVCFFARLYRAMP